MKLMIFLGIFFGGAVGSWMGASLSKGNYLSGWSILFGAIGSFAGIWVGFKIAQSIEG